MARRRKIRPSRKAERSLTRAFTLHLRRVISRRRNVRISKRVTELVEEAFEVLFTSATRQIPGAGALGDELRQRAVRDNIALIKNISDETVDVLRAAFAKGTPSVEVIQQTGQVQLSKAKFWARDQTLKINSQMTRERATAVGFPAYRWSTSRDERVRDTHVANQGKAFLWTDPPPTGHPGEDPNCRCTAFPLTQQEFDDAT